MGLGFLWEGEENVLPLDCGDGAQICEYTKHH